jgi:hypothetical protein
MVNILHYIGTDPEERKKLDNEAYWLRYEACNSGLVLELQDKLVEKDRDIAEKDKDLAEARRRNQNIAKELKSDGMPTEKISKSTEVPLGEIETINSATTAAFTIGALATCSTL